MIVFSAIMPHPPVSIPGIGTEDDFKRLEKTLKAIDELRRDFEKARPDTVVIISPHAYMEPYSFVINSEADLKGSFMKFGLDEVYRYDNDVEMSDMLSYACEMNEFPAHLHASFLDHGALIPLYHLTKNIKPKVVHLAFSMMDFRKHYMYGEIIDNVFNETNKRVAIIASGDLSHKLTPSAPAGYSDKAVLFDKRVIGNLERKNIEGFFTMENEIIEEAAECGLRSFLIMLGAIEAQSYTFRLMSYEGPFGIGYLVARFI